MRQTNSLPNICTAACLKPLCIPFNHDPTARIPTLANLQLEHILLATVYLQSSQNNKQHHIILEDLPPGKSPGLTHLAC